MIGYYKIKQGILQQYLRKYNWFQSADIQCEQFNKYVSTLKKEKEETNDKYPWLDQEDERRSMSDMRLGKIISVSFKKETSNGYVIKI